MKSKDRLDDIHKIRSENYEKTKNMSPSEYINYINKNASKLSTLIKKLETAHIFTGSRGNNKKAG